MACCFLGSSDEIIFTRYMKAVSQPINIKAVHTSIKVFVKPCKLLPASNYGEDGKRFAERLLVDVFVVA